MSSGSDSTDADINRSDKVRHASDDARKAAIAKMQAAIEASKQPEDTAKDSSVITHESSSDSSSTKANRADSPAKNRPGKQSSGSNKHSADSTTIENVKVYSPFKVYYDASASSVSAVNLTGPFDILAGHKNFITLLTEGDVIIRSSRGEEHITIERGIMHVSNNSVSVFLDV